MANKQGGMQRQNRAKQFMPFDALKGFREALLEKEKVIAEKRDLSEEQQEEIDRLLHQIRRNDMVSVEFFRENEYVKVEGVVSRLDADSKILEVVDLKIPFEDISALTDIRGRAADF